MAKKMHCRKGKNDIRCINGDGDDSNDEYCNGDDGGVVDWGDDIDDVSVSF